MGHHPLLSLFFQIYLFMYWKNRAREREIERAKRQCPLLLHLTHQMSCPQHWRLCSGPLTPSSCSEWQPSPNVLLTLSPSTAWCSSWLSSGHLCWAARCSAGKHPVDSLCHSVSQCPSPWQAKPRTGRSAFSLQPPAPQLFPSLPGLFMSRSFSRFSPQPVCLKCFPHR